MLSRLFMITGTILKVGDIVPLDWFDENICYSNPDWVGVSSLNSIKMKDEAFVFTIELLPELGNSPIFTGKSLIENDIANLGWDDFLANDFEFFEKFVRDELNENNLEDVYAGKDPIGVTFIAKMFYQIEESKDWESGNVEAELKIEKWEFFKDI